MKWRKLGLGGSWDVDRGKFLSLFSATVLRNQITLYILQVHTMFKLCSYYVLQVHTMLVLCACFVLQVHALFITSYYVHKMFCRRGLTGSNSRAKRGLQIEISYDTIVYTPHRGGGGGVKIWEVYPHPREVIGPHCGGCRNIPASRSSSRDLRPE